MLLCITCRLIFNTVVPSGFVIKADVLCNKTLAFSLVYRVKIKHLIIEVFYYGLLFTKLSWQYIDLKIKPSEMREIPCIKPSEEQAGRGFCDQCLRPQAEF